MRIKVSIMAFVFISLYLAGCTTTPSKVPNTDYYWYPLEGGGGPGSLIIASKNGVKLLTDTKWLASTNKKMAAVLATQSRPFPSVKWEKERTFGFGITADANLVASANSALHNSKRITTSVEKASVIYLSGEIVKQDMLKSLPISALESISSAIESNPDEMVYVVIEALRYEAASATIEFSNNIEGTANASALDTLFTSAGAKLAWIDGQKLNVKFPPDYYVAYKTTSIPLTSTEIRSAISLRKTMGDEIDVYRDKDGDGFGSPDERLTINIKNLPPGYVDNALDCYDKNANVSPIQTKWFEIHRGDGSFDYNCDGKEMKISYATGHCGRGCGSAQPKGWKNGVPNCGESHSWLDDCDNKPLRGGCNEEHSSKTMQCQ